MSDYPEHDKIMPYEDEVRNLSEFLEWLQGQGIVLARYGRTNGYDDPPQNPDRLYPLVASGYTLHCDYTGVRSRTPVEERGSLVETLIARYYGINRTKLEAEKITMLKKIREQVV